MSRNTETWSQVLRQILEDGFSGTQAEIADELKKKGYEINQSSISRQLRKLGAVRVTGVEGRIEYRLVQELEAPPAVSLSSHIRSIEDNGAMIVIRTSPGSASLVARQIDSMRSEKILGTLAGDDAVFVAPAKLNLTVRLKNEIRDKLVEALS
jgi:transcriptional regulator of arginine metabolism